MSPRCPGCEADTYADVLDDGERLRCRSCGEEAEAAAFSDPLAGAAKRGGYSGFEAPRDDT